jgi:16S rRNA C1402 (ribose-2'-O) methylase RsmI
MFFQRVSVTGIVVSKMVTKKFTYEAFIERKIGKRKEKKQ